MTAFQHTPIDRAQLQQIINRNPGITSAEVIIRMKIKGRNPLNRLRYLLNVMEADEKVFTQKDGRDTRLFNYQYAVDNNIQSVAPWKDDDKPSNKSRSEHITKVDQRMVDRLWPALQVGA
jgi:predicted transcriptional regulator